MPWYMFISVTVGDKINAINRNAISKIKNFPNGKHLATTKEIKITTKKIKVLSNLPFNISY